MVKFRSLNLHMTEASKFFISFAARVTSDLATVDKE